jgi:hypothetical protein
MRTLTLYPDRVHILGKTFLKNDFETSVQLRGLSPEVSKIKVRQKAFFQSFWLILLPIALYYGLTSILSVTLSDDSTGLILVLPLAGLALMAATFKKEEHWMFKNQAGILALGIARAGKDRDRFEEYVAKVVEAIRAANPSGEGA